MNNSARRARLIPALTLAAVALASTGCGGGGWKDDSAGPDAAGSSVSAGPAATPSAPAAGSGPAPSCREVRDKVGNVGGTVSSPAALEAGLNGLKAMEPTVTAPDVKAPLRSYIKGLGDLLQLGKEARAAARSTGIKDPKALQAKVTQASSTMAQAKQQLQSACPG